MLPWAAPLSWDGEVAVDVLVVDVLTDGGPEAVTKQETEKVVEVELNSRRRREGHFAWRSLVDRRETLESTISL